MEINARQLKKWLVRELGKVSGADPRVMADYVLTILNSDKALDMRAHCNDELRDLLQGKTKGFVDSLMGVIEGATDVFRARCLAITLSGPKTPRLLFSKPTKNNTININTHTHMHTCTHTRAHTH